MELNVFLVSVEDNGMLPQDNVFVHQETGTDSHVLHVQLDKPGTLTPSHAHALSEQTGTDSAVEVVPELEYGAIQSMIVSVEKETGTELSVLNVLWILTGME
jgi:hypothetical protein